MTRPTSHWIMDHQSQLLLHPTASKKSFPSFFFLLLIEHNEFHRSFLLFLHPCRNSGCFCVLTWLMEEFHGHQPQGKRRDCLAGSRWEERAVPYPPGSRAWNVGSLGLRDLHPKPARTSWALLPSTAGKDPSNPEYPKFLINIPLDFPPQKMDDWMKKLDTRRLQHPGNVQKFPGFWVVKCL